MDLKTWASSIASRGQKLARDGMTYVNTKIEKQQSQVFSHFPSSVSSFFQAQSSSSQKCEGSSGEVSSFFPFSSLSRSLPSSLVFYSIQNELSPPPFSPPSSSNLMHASDPSSSSLSPGEISSSSSSSFSSSSSSSLNAFLLPEGLPSDCISPSLFRELFPVKGNFVFRFKTPSNLSDSGFIWRHLHEDVDEYIPCFNGYIICRALQLPTGIAPPVLPSISPLSCPSFGGCEKEFLYSKKKSKEKKDLSFDRPGEDEEEEEQDEREEDSRRRGGGRRGMRAKERREEDEGEEREEDILSSSSLQGGRDSRRGHMDQRRDNSQEILTERYEGEKESKARGRNAFQDNEREKRPPRRGEEDERGEGGQANAGHTNDLFSENFFHSRACSSSPLYGDQMEESTKSHAFLSSQNTWAGQGAAAAAGGAGGTPLHHRHPNSDSFSSFSSSSPLHSSSSSAASGSGVYTPQTAVGPSHPPSLLRSREDLVADRLARTESRIQKKFQEAQERRQQELNRQQERLAVPEAVQQQLERWAKTGIDGKYKDIRTLLSTVHEVLWPEADWEPVPISVLMISSQVKKHYRKALLLTHPDKHQSSSAEQLFRAEKIFQAFNEAFKAHPL
ncbi:protein-tyrosine-phosphatase [Cystoisospora suis]|uniref:Protein-tyrosine-phosphatase n=1 Tax=Cystoisospora suis TaxID=483139 RepID=A0A2C6KYA5_9APIC|nr:protein-tyrosine-phosphatase [Cystoisospora suis]